VRMRVCACMYASVITIDIYIYIYIYIYKPVSFIQKDFKRSKVKVKVTLRLTVSQSVCLGVGHPLVCWLYIPSIHHAYQV
jgi:hypothetical protein